MTMKKILLIILAILGGVLLIGLCGGVVTAAGGGSEAPSIGTIVGESTAVAASAAAPAAPTAKVLAKSDIALTVKVTDKDCFGSAGCNVQYEIRAAITAGVVVPDECDVTYEVRGLDDPQVGTIKVNNEGRYTQDSFQFGQTPRSSSKLSAKVTELECQS